MVLLTYLLHLLQCIQAYQLLGDTIGVLDTPDDNAIQLSVTNINLTSKYTFKLIPNTSLPENSTLIIEFPDQYAFGLGISSPDCDDDSCQVEGRTVTVTLSDKLISGFTKTVVVNGVRNPSSPGGTGHFKLYTLNSGNIVDQNTMFGVVGIAGEAGQLGSSYVDVMVGGSYRAGETTWYDFHFKTGVLLDAGSWMRFTFPSNNFGLTTRPSCYSKSLFGVLVKGNLTCTNNDGVVQVQGISEQIQAGTYVLIRVQVTNPPIAITSGTFTIETGFEYTNTVSEQVSNVPGITFQPGLLYDVVFTPIDQNMVLSLGKIVDYRLSFTTYNEVEEGGSIRIEFNKSINPEIVDANFYDAEDGTCCNPWIQVQTGLTHQSQSNFLRQVYDDTDETLTFTNFMSLERGTVIEMNIRLGNPTEYGKSEIIVIKTFDSSGNQIDENNEDVFVTILDITGPSKYVIDFSIGPPLDFKLDITPQIEIPISGYIEISLPNEFTIVDSLVCVMTSKSTVSSTDTNCTQTNKIVRMQLGSATGSEFLPRVDNRINITQGLQLPTIGGDYLISVSTYTQDMVLLETGSVVMQLNPTGFNTITPTYLHKASSTVNVYDISFKPNIDIPAGRIESTLQGTFGFIELHFPTTDGTNDLFAKDLGLGISTGSVIECEGIANIVPITDNLICTATSVPTTVSTASPVIIKITNFQQIDSGTNAQLRFDGIFNPSTPNPAIIQVYIKERINNVEYTMIQDTTNWTITTVAIGGDTSADANTPTLTYKTINKLTTLSFSGQIVTAMTGPSEFLVYFNPVQTSMFCGDNLTCTVDNIVYSCRCSTQGKFVYINLESLTTIANTTRNFVISGLRNPSSVPLFDQKITFGTIDNSVLVDFRPVTAALPQLLPGSITMNSVQISSNFKGMPGQTYNLSFQIDNTISNNGQITLYFPDCYRLDSSSPLPTCSTNSLTPTNVTQGVSCVVQGNKVTLSDFQLATAGNTIKLEVKGVKTPSMTPSGFAIYTFDSAGNTIDQNASLSPPILQEQFIPGSVTFSNVESFPSNAKLPADLEVSFSIPSDIPAGGVITVTLPVDSFGRFNEEISRCRVSGQFKTFTSCSLIGRSGILVLDQKLKSNTIIQVIFSNILNPTQGITDNFLVTAEYDGEYLAITRILGAYEASFLTTTQYPETMLSKNGVDFYPKNEGEEATYSFNFTPFFDVEQGEILSIIFPEEFPLQLGDDFQCWSDQLLGELSCSVNNARMLDVTDFTAFNGCTSCDIDLHVSGIKNPNYNNGVETGSFRIGFRTGRHFNQYIDNIGNLSFLPAPGLIQLYDINVDNLYARFDNIFYFNFTTTNYISSTSRGGQLWVEFPDQYVLDFAEPYCLSSSYWASGIPQCTVDQNRVVLNGQTSQYAGTLDVTISFLPNPLFDEQADSILIKTYDSQNKQVIDRSYPSLAPLNLKFVYAGPVISINNNEDIHLVSGTSSNVIPILFDYPSALNMTITPSSADFSVSPYIIDIRVGDILKYFQISVPTTASPQTYYIEWTIQGDTEPPFFTPLLRTKVIVSNIERETVTISNISSVLIGGTTLPIEVELSNPADVQLILNIHLDYSEDGLSLSEEQLVFGTAEKTKSFVITADPDTLVVPGEKPMLSFKISGTNRNSFELSQSVTYLTLDYQNYPSPIITDVETTGVTKTTAVMNVRTNVIATIWYAIALNGTTPPTLDHIMNNVPPSLTTPRIVYGMAYSYDGDIDINLNNLEAETTYSVYVYAMDRLGRTTKHPTIRFFTTIERYQAAKFTLEISQPHINPDEEEDIRQALKLIFSLKNSRLIQSSTTYSTRGLLENDSVVDKDYLLEHTLIEYIIIDDLSNSNYPTPYQIANRLLLYKDRFKDYVPIWNENQVLVVTSIPSQICSFDKFPVIDTSSDYNTVRITSAISQEGYVYANLYHLELDNRNSTAYQIANGLNDLNFPTSHAMIKLPGKQLSAIQFTDLEELTDYSVHLSCGYEYPGQPVIRTIDETVILYTQTGVKPDPIPISLDSAQFLMLGALIMLLVQ